MAKSSEQETESALRFPKKDTKEKVTPTSSRPQAPIYRICWPEGTNYISKGQIELHLPLLHKITCDAKKSLQKLEGEMIYFKNNREQLTRLEKKMDQLLKNWSGKISRLGGTPLSLWKVKFQDGIREFTWEYPKKTFHQRTQ